MNIAARMRICASPSYVWQRINNSDKRNVDSIMLDQLVEESRRMRDKGQIQVAKM